MSKDLIEPLKYYNYQIKDEFYKSLEDYFDNLTKESDIDVEANRKSVKDYYELLEFKKDSGRKYKILKILSIASLVIGILFTLNIRYLFANYLSWYQKILCFFLSLLGLGIIYIRQTEIKKKLEIYSSIIDEYEDKCAQALKICYDQMAPLNKLFESDTTRQLINEAVPIIEIDKYLNLERFDKLKNHYGLRDNVNKNYSTLQLISGSIKGNPFVIMKDLVHELGTYTYEGSKDISWTETRYRSDGSVETIHKSQTLYARVTQPKPYYDEVLSLYYGNDAAPKLTFSRNPGHVHKFSENKREKLVRKAEKDLAKRASQAIKKGESFNYMANIEFEALFNALDRNNEQEFRLLFTPLSQRNMIDVLINSPYGDDFSFIKDKKINIIKAEHTEDWDINSNKERYRSFDYDASRNTFLDYNKNYLKHLYFMFSPILSIPLYQQHKSLDYIYEGNYNYNYTGYSTEVLANNFDKSLFSHQLTATDTILKTRPVIKEGKSDLVSVEARSYSATPKVTYVPVRGGDGYVHDVRVDWVQYDPLVKMSSMEVKDLGIRDLAYDEIDINSYIDSNSSVYKHGLIGVLTNNNQINYEDGLNKLIKKFSKEDM